MIESREHSYLAPRNVQPLRMTAQDVQDALPHLGLLGIDLRPSTINQMMVGLRDAAQAFGQDSLTATLTQASLGTPIQFLQNWLPGFVQILTAARKADELMGMQVSGDWADEEIVQGVMELTGLAIPYGDLTNVPHSSWNTNFVRRTIVRMEEGMQVGILEEERASKMRVNSAEGKREAAGLALEIARNNIAFSGFNSGNNLTYGFLNDPGLPAYVAAPNGTWESATFLEIQQDILTALNALRTQSGDQIDPKSTQITLGLPTNRVDFLSTPPVYGAGSVTTWLKENYPNVRVVSAPQLNNANSNQNVMYVYAESVQDQSSDGGRTWIQAIPAKFRILGVQKLAKGYEESYSNASAGAMLKRPWAVVRYTGL